MSVPAVVAHSTEYSQSKESIVKLGQIKIIHNIFSMYADRGIPEWCKRCEGIGKGRVIDQLYRNPKEALEFNIVSFDMQHRIVKFDDYCQAGAPNNKEIEACVYAYLSRFGKELKLIGNHQVSVDLYRMNASPHISNPAAYQLPWHFDKHAKWTMAAVLQNDFPQQGKGLDLTKNEGKGPFDPHQGWSFEDNHPSEEYISLAYPVNGAILFHNQRGSGSSSQVDYRSS